MCMLYIYFPLISAIICFLIRSNLKKKKEISRNFIYFILRNLTYKNFRKSEKNKKCLKGLFEPTVTAHEKCRYKHIIFFSCSPSSIVDVIIFFSIATCCILKSHIDKRLSTYILFLLTERRI